MKNIKISSEFITLGQLLKLLDLVSSGGETKFFLSTETVYVNGELENRRGRKLYSNDVIEIQGKKYQLIHD